MLKNIRYNTIILLYALIGIKTSYGQNATPKTTAMIHNIILKDIEGNNISTAKITMNKVVLKYSDAAQGYTFNFIEEGFCNIEVQCKNHEVLKERYYLTKNKKNINLFVLKKKASFYFRQGVKVPYLSNQSLLFCDSKNDSLIKTLNELQLIYKPYLEYIHSTLNYDSAHPSLNSAIIIFKKDNSNFLIKNCVELKRLREVSGILNIGPFVSHNKSNYPAFTFTNNFKVKLIKFDDVNYNLFYDELKKLNIGDYEILFNETEGICSIKLKDTSINQDVICISEKIGKLKNVEFVDSNLSSYSNLD